MNKKLVFSAMLVCLLALGLAFVGCDNGSTGGGGGDTYSVHGSGLTSSEWTTYGLGSITPPEMIDQNYSDIVVAQFISNLAQDEAGVHHYGQSEAQIRTLLEGYGNDTVNTIISKLKSQGWVFYSTTSTVDQNDYADIVGIIKE